MNQFSSIEDNINDVVDRATGRLEYENEHLRDCLRTIRRWCIAADHTETFGAIQRLCESHLAEDDL